MLSVNFLVLFWIGIYFFVFILYFFSVRERTGNSVGQEVGRIWEELGERREYDPNILHEKIESKT